MPDEVMEWLVYEDRRAGVVGLGSEENMGWSEEGRSTVGLGSEDNMGWSEEGRLLR